MPSIGQDLIEGIDATFFGARAGAPASVNQLAIQRALSVGGYVTLNTPGTYAVSSDTFTYPVNTVFALGPGVVFTINGVETSLSSVNQIRTGFGKSSVLAMSAVAYPLTGTTTATELARAVIDPNIMGPNGALRVTAMWSMTNNANNKTFIVKHGSKTYYQAGITSANGGCIQFIIANRGATGSQIGVPTSIINPFGSLTQPFNTGSEDTSASSNVLFIGQLANSADTITLEFFMVELLRQLSL